MGAALILLSAALGFLGVVRIYQSGQKTNCRTYQSRSDGRWAAFVAIAIMVGWFAGIYGTILILSAVAKSASLDPRPEDICVHPTIITEFELIHIGR